MKKRAEDLKIGLMKSYAKVAENANFSCSAGCLTKSASVEEIGRRIGYEKREMEAVPPGSNLGLGCISRSVWSHALPGRICPVMHLIVMDITQPLEESFLEGFRSCKIQFTSMSKPTYTKNYSMR